MINKHKSNKIKENSNTVRHLNNGTDHRHSKSCCDQSSPARRTTRVCRSSLSVSLYIQRQDLRVSAYITVFNRACQRVIIYVISFYIFRKSMKTVGPDLFQNLIPSSNNYRSFPHLMKSEGTKLYIIYSTST